MEMEQFLDTGKLFLLVWGGVAAFVFFVAVFFAEAQGLKHGTVSGLGIGLIAANVAILERPHGLLVIIVEALVIIILGALWVLGRMTRTVEIDGVGTWHERGPSCLQPIDPATRAITASGNAQIGVIGAQTGFVDAETQHLIADAERWARQTEFERLRLTGRDR